MIDASWAAVVRSRSLSSLFEHLDVVVIAVQPIDWSVSAPTPRYFLMKRSISVDVARTGCISSAGRQAQFIQTAGIKNSRGNDLDAVPVFRQRHQPVIEQDPGGKPGEHLLGRSVFLGFIFQINEADIEFVCEKPENLFFVRPRGRARRIVERLPSLRCRSDLLRGFAVDQRFPNEFCQNVFHLCISGKAEYWMLNGE